MLMGGKVVTANTGVNTRFCAGRHFVLDDVFYVFIPPSLTAFVPVNRVAEDSARHVAYPSIFHFHFLQEVLKSFSLATIAGIAKILGIVAAQMFTA